MLFPKKAQRDNETRHGLLRDFYAISAARPIFWIWGAGSGRGRGGGDGGKNYWLVCWLVARMDGMGWVGVF